MGFLVTIKYHPKLADGKFGYDTEKEEEKTLKIGKKEEEISQENLAMAIIKQLSRRDILVKEVEAIEYVKKVIKVRESKNGIIIGNKKYSFNDIKDLSSFCVEEINENPVPNNQNINPLSQNNIIPPQINTNNLQVIREEFFEPEPTYIALKDQFAKAGLTIGKKYKIIKEIGTPSISGGVDVYKYRVINDFGGKIEVPIQHFTAVSSNQQALYNKNVVEERASSEIPLSYGTEINTNIPHLR